MKTLNMTFDNEDFDELQKAKKKLKMPNWESFMILILKYIEEDKRK